MPERDEGLQQTGGRIGWWLALAFKILIVFPARVIAFPFVYAEALMGLAVIGFVCTLVWIVYQIRASMP